MGARCGRDGRGMCARWARDVCTNGRKFSSFLIMMKEKGRRVVNDKFAISCSIEVLSIGDNGRADGGRMAVVWWADALAMRWR